MAEDVKALDSIEAANLSPTELLSFVNDFYSEALSNLLLTTLGIVGFVGVIVGVIVPIVISYMQTRALRLSIDSIKDEVVNQIVKEESNELMTLSQDYAELNGRVSDLSAKLIELDAEVRRSRAYSSALVFHVQGQMNMDNSFFIAGFHSLVTAASNYIDAEDGLNLGRCISLIQNCLDTFSSVNLPDIESLNSFEMLIEKLQSFNYHSRYSDDINRLKANLDFARNRPPPAP